MTLIIVLIVIVVLAVLLIGIYNRLVALRQNANQAFADIDVQLKQRHDLIPNLVETAKGYAAHEKGTNDNLKNAESNTVVNLPLEKSIGKVFAINLAVTFDLLAYPQKTRQP